MTKDSLKIPKRVRSEPTGSYTVVPQTSCGPIPKPPTKKVDLPPLASYSAEVIIARAIEVLDSRIRTGPIMGSPDETRKLLRLRFQELEHEVFVCLWLDNHHKVIEIEELFRGTIDGASIYPREVVKSALKHNAAAVIFAHNHPSGGSEPSDADKHITQRLKTALGTVDIRVLDHLVVGAPEVYSFAEHGLI